VSTSSHAPLAGGTSDQPVGPHLGERVSAFVDDALAEDAYDRALVHLAGCDQCRSEVDSARLLKTRLSILPTPNVHAGLTARLLAMADPGGPIPPRPGHLPGQPRNTATPRPISASGGPGGSERPATGRPQGTRPAGRANRETRRSGRRSVRLAALAGAALSTMVVAVVGLSGAVGPEQPQTSLTQLSSTISGGGAGGVGGVTDPFVDVSKILKQVAAPAGSTRTP
jgi:hypothetical protein